MTLSVADSNAVAAERLKRRRTLVRSGLILVLKLGITSGSLTILLYTIDLENFKPLLRKIDVWPLVVALAIHLVGQVVSAQRFIFVARALGAIVPFWESVRIHFIGLWFNQVLPTGMGGDVVKAALFKSSIGLGRAMRCAILDRLSGFLIVLLSVLVFLPLYQWRLGNWAVTGGLLVLSLGLIGALVLAMVLAGSRWWQRLMPSRLIGLMQPFLDLDSFRPRGRIVEQLWTSFAVQICGILAYGMIGAALGIKLDFVVYWLLVPLVFLVALIPISLAGWGLREVGAVGLFRLVDLPDEQGLAMSVIFGLLLIAAGLPGLILLMGHRRSGHRKQ